MSRSNETEDVRIAKAVTVLCEKVTRSENLNAEGNEGEFARIRCEGVALLRGIREGFEGKFGLEGLERSLRSGDHGCSIIRRGITRVMSFYERDNKRCLPLF